LRNIVAMPLHDPKGILLPLLVEVTPQLKQLYERVFVALTPLVQQQQPGRIQALQADPFFRLVLPVEQQPVGVQLRELFSLAAAESREDDLLHLCFPDRVVFALLSDFREAFMADVRSLAAGDVPLIFQRSKKAWASHPANYAEIEGLVTRVGELLLGRSLDFAWCYLVTRAGRLAKVLPGCRGVDFSVEAEIILPMLAELSTRDVDWLAWEDPFLYKADPAALKAAREADPQEVVSRLGYAVSMLKLLAEFTGK
jgi:hypothetical protein